MYVPEISTIKDSISHWYIVFTLGLIFLAAGMLILIRPYEAMMALATLLGIAFLFAGVIEIYFAFANRTVMSRWAWPLTFGILTALVGLFFITVPQFTVLVMTLALGAIVVFRSIAAVSFSMDVRLIGGEFWWVYMLLAIAGIFFSFALIVSHLLLKEMINEWTGLSLLAVGVYNAFLGLRLRRLKGVSNLLSDELLKKYYNVRQEIREELSNLEREKRINR
ncbi:MAG: DUF308 domain-containing protein [Robiginitalea sp.]|jgi:uncharacterized membrane protein HdeD (DUF308 family)